MCVAYRTNSTFYWINSQNNEICLKGGYTLINNLLIKSLSGLISSFVKNYVRFAKHQRK